MKRIATALCALMLAPSVASSGTDFGTREEATDMANALIEILDTDGLSAGVKALFDPKLPFARSPLGINLFAGSVVVGDNREPEMVAADYAETSDLTGALVWDLVDVAADVGEDVVLKWYHYDTQAIYDFHCYSKHSGNGEYTVMVCR